MIGRDAEQRPHTPLTDAMFDVRRSGSPTAVSPRMVSGRVVATGAGARRPLAALDGVPKKRGARGARRGRATGSETEAEFAPSAPRAVRSAPRVRAILRARDHLGSLMPSSRAGTMRTSRGGVRRARDRVERDGNAPELLPVARRRPRRTAASRWTRRCRASARARARPRARPEGRRRRFRGARGSMRRGADASSARGSADAERPSFFPRPAQALSDETRTRRR